MPSPSFADLIALFNSGGDRELRQWIRGYRVETRLALDDKPTADFVALAERVDKHPHDLLEYRHKANS